MDRRNLRTRKALRQALIRLSRDKAYPDMTVLELCREAGVSRSAFYSNYKSPNDLIGEISMEYMEMIRGKRLTREFFDALTKDGDELKLLLETGIFGREFSLYLKELIDKEFPPAPDGTNEELALNVKTLYHAFGIFGVLINLSKLHHSQIYDTARAESVATLTDLAGQLCE